MMFGLNSRHDKLRGDIEDWLARHPDPRDPLTKPVELLLALFLAATSWRAAVARMVWATLVATAIILALDAVIGRPANTVVMTRADEARVMQQWIDSREAVRVMRCEGEGLEFTGGRCHTTAGGGWLIPRDAQQALAAPRAALSTTASTTMVSPWGR